MVHKSNDMKTEDEAIQILKDRLSVSELMTIPDIVVIVLEHYANEIYDTMQDVH